MVSGGLIVSGTPPLAGFRTSQVREPNQWFWRDIHLYCWMPSLGYHGDPSWDHSFSWSIFMTYLMYQGVYQTPDCSQMIGWYTIRPVGREMQPSYRKISLPSRERRWQICLNPEKCTTEITQKNQR